MDYLKKYRFDWDLIESVIGGRAALDMGFFGRLRAKEQVDGFLLGYGLNPDDPVVKAELYGNFQEALQFIRRYFISEAQEHGIVLTIPPAIFTITDITELFLIGGSEQDNPSEEALWADIILKVMHIILHIDKDLRAGYFVTTQMQIFDRFYKYVCRDQDNSLYLATNSTSEGRIPLVDFHTKSKKPRDSVIIKLLHKAENVAEDLFDRIGMRFVTKNKFDTLRVVKFLVENNVVIPHNTKPSRAFNAIIDTEGMKREWEKLAGEAAKEEMPEDVFYQKLVEIAENMLASEKVVRNPHSLREYKSIQFTCRHLISYSDPFWAAFNRIRTMAKSQTENNELAQKIASMELSHTAGDTLFFYPYEIQIVDIESHRVNSEGEASHQQYKRAQLKSAMSRLFKRLFEKKGISIA